MITYNVEDIYEKSLTDIELKNIINKKIYDIINNQEMTLYKDWKCVIMISVISLI